jgi:hypothetical protein
MHRYSHLSLNIYSVHCIIARSRLGLGSERHCSPLLPDGQEVRQGCALAHMCMQGLQLRQMVVVVCSLLVIKVYTVYMKEKVRRNISRYTLCT